MQLTRVSISIPLSTDRSSVKPHSYYLEISEATAEYVRNQQKRNNLQKNDLNQFFEVYLKHKSTLRKWVRIYSYYYKWIKPTITISLSPHNPGMGSSSSQPPTRNFMFKWNRTQDVLSRLEDLHHYRHSLWREIRTLRIWSSLFEDQRPLRKAGGVLIVRKPLKRGTLYSRFGLNAAWFRKLLRNIWEILNSDTRDNTSGQTNITWRR